MQNAIVKSQSSIPAPPEQDCDRYSWSDYRCWKVTIGYNTEVFITEAERDYYLSQLANGKKIIKVGEIVLTNKFMAITKVR